MDKVKNIKRSGGFRRKVQRILKNNLMEFPPSFHCGAEVNNPDGPSTSGSVPQTQQSSISFSPASTVQQHFCTEALIESDVSGDTSTSSTDSEDENVNRKERAYDMRLNLRE